MRDADITARVTLLGELTGEELVELGAEDTVGHELAFLADLSGHLGRPKSAIDRGVSPWS